MRDEGVWCHKSKSLCGVWDQDYSTSSLVPIRYTHGVWDESSRSVEQPLKLQSRAVFIGIMQKREQALQSYHLRLQYFPKPKDSCLWHQTPSPHASWVGSGHETITQEHTVLTLHVEWLVDWDGDVLDMRVWLCTRRLSEGSKWTRLNQPSKESHTSKSQYHKRIYQSPTPKHVVSIVLSYLRSSVKCGGLLMCSCDWYS